MLKISDAIKEIINGNSALKFAMHNKLLNLSRTAQFLKPLIETRVKKDVQVNAVTMNLSRLQKNISQNFKENKFEIENISVQNSLCTMTFYKTNLMRGKIYKLYSQIKDKKGFITITLGVSEITIIFDKTFKKLIQKYITQKPKYENENLSSVCVKFDEKYIQTPGLLYLILQQVSLQGINIIELNSTATEFIIYIQEKDVKLAFDTIYNKFS